ncbi:protein phosphatase 2C domain-containing protein [Aestuariibius insulae]|uniref:PP2C family protein-serine/threonine phosphatase n=1 Tax=Aestuariibius insulae TaxID=2058287 RepID=UPI00345E7DF1
MWRSPEPRFDVASAIAQGGRDYQEDAIITDFPFGADTGLAVLADGMGGHAAGDVASKIVVTEVFSELKFQSANLFQLEHQIPDMMTEAATIANDCVRSHVQENPETRGMGATLVSLVLVENRMYWMSIGDSPLYHYRSGKMSQLNEDHSMAPQIDFMVQSGLLDPETGKNHPDRNCLTSVILGEKVARSDCPKKPFELKLGDIVVVSSDGLQYLEEAKIEKILHRYRRRRSAEIAGYLLEALDGLADPDQDNISFSVIKMNHMKPTEQKVAPKPIDYVEASAATTRLVTPEVAIKVDPEAPIERKVQTPPVFASNASEPTGKAPPIQVPPVSAPPPEAKEEAASDNAAEEPEPAEAEASTEVQSKEPAASGDAPVPAPTTEATEAPAAETSASDEPVSDEDVIQSEEAPLRVAGGTK